MLEICKIRNDCAINIKRDPIKDIHKSFKKLLFKGYKFIERITAATKNNTKPQISIYLNIDGKIISLLKYLAP
jgi:hypothetical protein